MASNTNFRLLGDELIIFSTSALATCSSTASLRSRLRRSTSSFSASSIGARATNALPSLRRLRTWTLCGPIGTTLHAALQCGRAILPNSEFNARKSVWGQTRPNPAFRAISGAPRITEAAALAAEHVMRAGMEFLVGLTTNGEDPMPVPGWPPSTGRLTLRYRLQARPKKSMQRASPPTKKTRSGSAPAAPAPRKRSGRPKPKATSLS